VINVGSWVFDNCSALNDTLYNSKLFVYMPTRAAGSYVVPEGIKTIAPSAFQYCSYITNVTLPEGLTTIGAYAFSYCKVLESITLPASTEYVGDYAFENLATLDVYANPTTPPLGASNLFGYATYNGKIYVPLASVDAYKTADYSTAAYWYRYADNIMDNQPRVNWARGANTENWTVTAGGTAITPGETIVAAGTTVTVEYTGTRTVDLKAAVTMERQGNKWTFAMPELPLTLRPIIGVASVGGELYSSFPEALSQAQYNDTVKLEYDVVMSSGGYYMSKTTIIDLNGYTISAADDYAHLYLYPYYQVTVIDSSEEQKGGIKMKFELPTGYSSEKFNLTLMAGRYVYTADEISTNGYNGYGVIAENINADGSADADGYISKMRPMTADEKGKAAYDINKATFKFTLEGVGSTEMTVVKNQKICLTPPTGWKFGQITRQGSEYWGGSWNGISYVIGFNNISEDFGELVANLVPDPEKLVDQLEGITLTQSDDKTSVTLKGAGGKSVTLYSENGATLMTQQVEMYKLATFKGLTTGKTYYIGVDNKLIKVDTNL
jgi:hypothetical protein